MHFRWIKNYRVKKKKVINYYTAVFNVCVQCFFFFLWSLFFSRVMLSYFFALCWRTL